MKYIKRHAPIQFTDPLTGKPYPDLHPMSFESYLNGYPLNDKRFSPGEGFSAVIAGGKIQVAAKGTSPYVALEDADYKILLEAVEKPNMVAGSAMAPEMARQVAPMMQAIIDATSTAPEKKAKAKRAKKAKKATAISPSDAGAEVVN